MKQRKERIDKLIKNFKVNFTMELILSLTDDDRDELTEKLKKHAKSKNKEKQDGE